MERQRERERQRDDDDDDDDLHKVISRREREVLVTTP